MQRPRCRPRPWPPARRRGAPRRRACALFLEEAQAVVGDAVLGGPLVGEPLSMACCAFAPLCSASACLGASTDFFNSDAASSTSAASAASSLRVKLSHTSLPLVVDFMYSFAEASRLFAKDATSRRANHLGLSACSQRERLDLEADPGRAARPRLLEPLISSPTRRASSGP